MSDEIEYVAIDTDLVGKFIRDMLKGQGTFSMIYYLVALRQCCTSSGPYGLNAWLDVNDVNTRRSAGAVASMMLEFPRSDEGIEELARKSCWYNTQDIIYALNEAHGLEDWVILTVNFFSKNNIEIKVRDVDFPLHYKFSGLEVRDHQLPRMFLEYAKQIIRAGEFPCKAVVRTFDSERSELWGSW